MTSTRARPRFTVAQVSTQVILLIVAVVSLAPLVMIWLAALKSNGELATNPLGLPRAWKFSNFIDAWQTANLGSYLGNSILTALPTLVVVLLAASLTGYALACLKFRAREPLFALFLIGLMVPTVSLVVPVYYTVVDFGLLDTRAGLILPEIAVALPLAVFIMRSAFRDLPGELREAVLIDGGSEWDCFLRVMLPLARPALATVTVLTFLGVWNSFLYPLVLINSDSLRTMPLGLAYLQGRYVANIVLMAAATSLTSIPTILIYIVFQRQFIKGIVEGSFK